jgi:hypothetical protein
MHAAAGISTWLHAVREAQRHRALDRWTGESEYDLRAVHFSDLSDQKSLSGNEFV